MSRFRFVTGILAAAALVSCARGTASQPAGAVSPPQVQLGAFVWHDLVTDDVATARRFYGDLFGWTFEETTRQDHPYVLARLGSDYVGGLVQITDETPARPESQWLSYLSVADVDQAVDQAGKAGGRTIVAPLTLEGIARVAVIEDSEKVPLGLARSFGGDVEPAAPPPAGHFFWMEYLARDADAALAFYRPLGGYDASVSAERDGLRYYVLKNTRSRAGLFAIPANQRDIPPTWLPYVRVDDPAAMAARVTQLGGRVLLSPRADARNGTLAIVADPSGAPLALQKWPM